MGGEASALEQDLRHCGFITMVERAVRGQVKRAVLELSQSLTWCQAVSKIRLAENAGITNDIHKRSGLDLIDFCLATDKMGCTKDLLRRIYGKALTEAENVAWPSGQMFAHSKVFHLLEELMRAANFTIPLHHFLRGVEDGTNVTPKRC